MKVAVSILIVWLAGIAGCVAMNKIQPGNRLYPVYVLIVCVIFTIFLLSLVA